MKSSECQYSTASVDRAYKSFSNFFQSSLKKLTNLDPNSGVHLVGPMFALMAGIDNKRGSQDFDADYPDSGLSYGPTICSFGLPYNDHNYAQPIGLTPPTMAPHLMDLPPGRLLTVSTKASNESAPSSSTSVSVGMSPTARSLESIGSNKEAISSVQVAPRSVRSAQKPALDVKKTSDEATIAANIAESTAGLSEPKKTLFGAWHAKAAASGGTLVVQQRWKDQEVPTVLRYVKPAPKMVEDMELRYELEMKVIEVPADICVSPSQLSCLNSDSSDDDDSDSQLQNQNQKSKKQPAWFTVNCPCGLTFSDGNTLQCIKCRLLQHVECMEKVLTSTAELTATGSTNTTSNQTPSETPFVLNPSSYICNTCLSLTIDSSLRALLISNATQRQAMALGSGGQPNQSLSFVGEVIEDSQLLANATNKARQLGLVDADQQGIDDCAYNPTTPNSRNGDMSAVVDFSTTSPTSWNKLSQTGRFETIPTEDTNVNLRMPSPPRASKRKQDLTTSYDATRPVGVPDATVVASDYARLSTTSTAEEPLSALSTPSTVPGVYQPRSASSTPVASSTTAKLHPLAYHHHLKVYSLSTQKTPILEQTGGTSSTTSETATPENSPLLGRSTSLQTSDRRKKLRKTLFDSPRGSPRKAVQDAFPSTFGSAWAKDYHEATTSTYTQALLEYISERVNARLENNERLAPTCLGRTALCRVVLFDHNNKGLEASVRLSLGDVVSELRGHLMLLHEYEHFVDPASEYKRFVILYRDFGDRGVAVDTTQYGNDARFIRRSCTPNCALGHFIVGGKMHVIVRTTHEVAPGEELTLPFDVDYRACRYPLDCACGRSRCPVSRWRRKLVRNKVMPNLDYSKYIESQLRALSKPLSDEGARGFSQTDHSSSVSNSPVSKGSDGASPVLSRRPLISSTSVLSPQRFTKTAASPISSSVWSPVTRLFALGIKSTTASMADRQIFPTTDIQQTVPSTQYLSKAELPQSDPFILTSPSVKPAMSKVCVSPTPDCSLEKLSEELCKSVEPPVTRRSRKRPARISEQLHNEKKSKSANTRSSPPPFQPIITTRRQAAASQRLSESSPEKVRVFRRKRAS